MPAPFPQQKIVILGDSTIDNRVWLGKEKYLLFLSHMRFIGPILTFLIKGIAALVPKRFKAKSVVENLCAQMPNITFIDRTNDGFTTTDILIGAYKDKVFGTGAHRFFPHEAFYPLQTSEIKNADQIILSIGGNNFREFILTALSQPLAQRETFIKDNYPKVFDKMTQEYKEILKYIAKENPNAHIILMTQYYPGLKQDVGFFNIYHFMKILGKILNKGDKKDTIVEVMKDTYTHLLKFIAQDNALKNNRVSVIDVTSSLNPNFSKNYVAQIEPSGTGGQQIASMLNYAIHTPNHGATKNIYRFNPDFFNKKSISRHKGAHRTGITENFQFIPIHPNNMPKPKDNNKNPKDFNKIYQFVCASEPGKTIPVVLPFTPHQASVSSPLQSSFRKVTRLKGG